MFPRSIWAGRAGVVLLLVFLVLLARESALRSIDFPVYHRAAQQVLSGDFRLYPAEVYAGRPQPSQGFRYAPAIAVLFVPFGWLPLPLAALAFFALKLVALWYIGVVIAHHAAVPARWRSILIAALAVAGYLVEEFRFGNVHFFCVALLVFAYDRAESGRVLAPAAALAVAIATKVTPIALLGYFAYRRRGALCATTVVLVCLLIAMPAAFVGIDTNARELRAFATYALEKVDEGDNYSIRGALDRYLTAGHADISHVEASVADLSPTIVNGLWVLGLGMLGLAGLSALSRESDDPVVRLLEFSIVMTGIVLASPHTQRRYYVALYVPAVTLVALWRSAAPGWERRTIVAGLVAMAAPSTILPLVFAGRRLALLYEAGSPYLFGALVLFGLLIAMTRRRKARSFSAASAATV